MNARTFNRAGIRFAEEQTALSDDRRTLARVRRLLGARPGHVVSAVRNVLEDRARLALALEDAVHRMAFDRDALGLPESRESQNARVLLEEFRAVVPVSVAEAVS